VAKETAGDMEWYLSDHLGSTTLLVDENGSQVERTEYFPYGAIESGGSEKYGFTGQENDADTGLMYYGARYYSPEFRVFVQPDTLLPDPYNPQALNRYSYCLNNPLRYTDPSGHFALPLDTILDGLFTLYDTGNYILKPSEENKDNLKWSAASTLLPYVPGRYVKPLLKFIPPDDLIKMGKYAPDALKSFGYSDEFAYAVKRGDNILAASNARGKTIWLAEGNERWGWNHIVKNRIVGEGGNNFLAFGDEYADIGKCKDLVMETVEKGTYINKPGSSEAFIMQVNDKYSLKVAFNEHGSINTAFTMPNKVASKEIAEYGGKR
jgi:RHS repeat-associated protein